MKQANLVVNKTLSNDIFHETIFMVSIQASAYFSYELVKIVPLLKTKKSHEYFLLQSKLQSREISHSTRTENSSTLGSNSRVSGTKRDGIK
jgi:hypothetical protein